MSNHQSPPIAETIHGEKDIKDELGVFERPPRRWKPGEPIIIKHVKKERVTVPFGNTGGTETKLQEIPLPTVPIDLPSRVIRNFVEAINVECAGLVTVLNALESFADGDYPRMYCYETTCLRECHRRLYEGSRRFEGAARKPWLAARKRSETHPEIELSHAVVMEMIDLTHLAIAVFRVITNSLQNDEDIQDEVICLMYTDSRIEDALHVFAAKYEDALIAGREKHLTGDGEHNETGESQ
jgi:hypothetical protein